MWITLGSHAPLCVMSQRGHWGVGVLPFPVYLPAALLQVKAQWAPACQQVASIRCLGALLNVWVGGLRIPCVTRRYLTPPPPHRVCQEGCFSPPSCLIKDQMLALPHDVGS